MSETTNARSDAKLKRLPMPVIAELVRRCQEPGVTQKDVLAWLRDTHGVSSSPAALSQAYSYLCARVRSHEREQKIQAWLECEKLEHPELTDEELFRRGQRKFSLLSIAEEDPKGWALIQKTERDKEVAALDRQKFQRETVELFLKWSADEEARKIATSNASSAEKTEKLGQRIFGELWE